jgi:hypothetical protein
MDALVFELGDELEIVNGVVELVSVPVVDVMAVGYAPAVVLLPDVDMFHDLPAPNFEASVSLSGDVSSQGDAPSHLQDWRK